jgi:hypothetical protein
MNGRYLSNGIRFGVTDRGGMWLLSGLELEPENKKPPGDQGAGGPASAESALAAT